VNGLSLRNLLGAGIQEANWRGRLIRYAPLLFWVGVIFYFSSGHGSFDETSRFIRPLLEFFFPTASPETLALYHGYIRKFAHPAVYAVLAILAARAFVSSSLRSLSRHFISYALILSFAVAVLDELNQAYVASRTGSAWDVALDSVGAAAALLVVYLIVRRRSSAKTARSTPPADR
jgi:VanZ family protein